MTSDRTVWLYNNNNNDTSNSSNLRVVVVLAVSVVPRDEDVVDASWLLLCAWPVVECRRAGNL